MTAASSFIIPLLPLVAAILITPGLVISFVSSRFTMGRPGFSTTMVASSTIYYATLWLLAGFFLDIKSSSQIVQGIKDINYYSTFILITIIPAVIGMFTGIAIQRKWFYDLMRWKRIPKFLRPNPIIGTPSAWDSVS